SPARRTRCWTRIACASGDGSRSPRTPTGARARSRPPAPRAASTATRPPRRAHRLRWRPRLHAQAAQRVRLACSLRAPPRRWTLLGARAGWEKELAAMPSARLNRRLTAQDASFLYIDRPHQPMHGAWVGLYEGEMTLDEVRRAIEARLHLVPRYRQKVVFPPFGIAHPTWEDD